MSAVILYGPPAAGKDTITAALTNLDQTYQLYRRLKVGTGRTDGYRMTTLAHVARLRSTGDVLWETHRYNALYLIDRATLAGMLTACIPVLHAGEPEAVKAVTGSLVTQWVVAWLWCSRDIAARRIASRETDDSAARLHAWDQTESLPHADIAINTAEVEPGEAAAMIHRRVQASR
jgi:guanylate kinase